VAPDALGRWLEWTGGALAPTFLGGANVLGAPEHRRGPRDRPNSFRDDRTDPAHGRVRVGCAASLDHRSLDHRSLDHRSPNAAP
jgi:hypothetical protein